MTTCVRDLLKKRHRQAEICPVPAPSTLATEKPPMMKSPLAAGLVLATLLGGAAAHAGQPPRPTFRAGFDVASDNVFRGIVLNDDVVFQPSFDMDYCGFTFSAWGNMDLTDYGSMSSKGGYGDRRFVFSETQGTAAYHHAFGKLTLRGGFMRRDFPGTVFGPTTEGFVSLKAQLPVVLEATCTRDVAAAGGWYLRMTAGHSFRLTPRNALDVGVGCAWSDGTYNRYTFGVADSAVSDAEAHLALSTTVNRFMTVKTAASFTDIVDQDLADTVARRDHVAVSSGASFRF